MHYITIRRLDAFDARTIDNTYTFRSLDPSTETRVLLPTISPGWTRSSKILSWTLVSVRLRGLFCFTRELRVGLDNTLR